MSGIERGNICDSRDSGIDLNGQYWEELLQRNLVLYSGSRDKGNCWFVTYSCSQVEDKNECFRVFQISISIDRHVRSKDKKQANVRIFGCKEVCAEGVSYYVANWFSKRAGWRQARPVFTVYIDDEKQVADTSSSTICRRKPVRKEELTLGDIQELLLAKSGDIFGAWDQSYSDFPYDTDQIARYWANEFDQVDLWRQRCSWCAVWVIVAHSRDLCDLAGNSLDSSYIDSQENTGRCCVCELFFVHLSQLVAAWGD